MTSPSYRLTEMPADAAAAAIVRERFAAWLRRRFQGEPRLCDVILAVNEVVANVAEYAYRDVGGSGTFDLQADHDPAGATLTVSVRDHGRWRDTDPLAPARERGRGISLMRTLADSVVIDTSARGTVVCLRFERMGVSGRAAACMS